MRKVKRGAQFKEEPYPSKANLKKQKREWTEKAKSNDKLMRKYA